MNLYSGRIIFPHQLIAAIMVLFFQLLMGTLTGPLGLLFATPILVAIVNLVNEIYVMRVLKQETAGELIEEIENLKQENDPV